MTTELIQTLDRYCKSQILYASTMVALSVLYESVTGDRERANGYK